MPAELEDRVKDLERRMNTLEDAYDNLPGRMHAQDDEAPQPKAKDRDPKK